jgi:ribosomal protein L24E
MKPICVQCGRAVRAGGTHLWDVPGGKSLFVCGKKCLDAFNDDEPPRKVKTRRVIEVIDDIPIVEKVPE